MRSDLAFLVVAASSIAGCGDRVPDFGIDLTPPEVVSISPADGAVSIDRETEIVVIFSEVIHASTVSAETFLVLRDGVDVPGTRSVVGSSATFTASSRFRDLTEYEVVVTEDVRDVSGHRLRDSVVSSFVTEDLEWEEPFDVSPGGTGAYWGSGAIGREGEVFLVWNDSSGISARRILDGIDQPVTLLANGDTGNANVVASDDGHALAIWTRDNAGRSDLHFSTWDPVSETWSSPGLVETLDTGFVGTASLAMNAAGFAVAAWNQSDSLTPPFRLNIYIRSYSIGSGWSPVAVPLESRTETAEPPEVGVGLDGTYVVNWVQSDGSVPRLWAATSESPAAIIETTADVSVGRSFVDSYGNPLVVWGSGFNYFHDGAWNGPTSFEGGLVAAVAEGPSLVAWNDAAGGIAVASVSSAGTVGATEVIAQEGAVLAAGMDDAGRAFVLSRRVESGFLSLFSSRRGLNGWTSPQLIEHDDGDAGYVTRVDVRSSGEGVITYFRFDGVGSRMSAALLR